MAATTSIPKSTARTFTMMYLLGGSALVLVLAAAFVLFASGRAAQNDTRFLGYVSELGLLSQTLAKSTGEALRGNAEAFQALATARDRFQQLLESVDRQAPAAVRGELQLLVDNWRTARDATGTVLAARDSIQIAQAQAAIVAESMPELLGQLDRLAETLARGGGNPRLLHHLGRQLSFGQRLQRDTLTLTSGVGDVAGAARRLEEDSAYFARIMRALYEGDAEFGLQPLGDPAARSQRDAANPLFLQVKGALDTLVSVSETLVGAAEASGTLAAAADRLLASARTIESTYRRAMEARLISDELGFALGGVAILLFIGAFFFFTLTADIRKAAAMQAEQQERNQEAILRLLDELGSLADGDLTVQATVTEDITGAIADSINFAIEALRDLVVTINQTALQVDAAAKQTQATASHLAEMSNNQSKQITSATQQIAQMATSIEQVSGNAERAARVAQQSVEIATKGGEAVRRTIEGMNNIRETIQETSKRIKRLGESSQEIGNIVELINDIAEQTNILALNAAIQASMAGEAGRGFAVVADEVQRLAERSANATKQIETLVKTIQADTNEAVSSMEQSTAGVVSGAQLAENAGSALDEIEKVSHHIATLIQSISSAARQQAIAAADVARTMNVIQEITSQTAEGTNATARNIGKLAALATELRKSVAGFKLPGMEAGETMVMTAELKQRA
ncbi:MAG TPA: methyl-accepting chemotaxis protein [Gammaproteobacteria bacterium]|nr:methyl-accepting chemotaxis protein [Gammaproteobacteria bacterium]